MTPILAIARLFPAWVWTALAGVMACIIVGAVSFHNGRRDGIETTERKHMEASMAALARDAAAKEAASAERLADAIETQKLTEELRHAVQNLPDATPSDRRTALACQRLRNQGTDTTRLSQCR